MVTWTQVTAVKGEEIYGLEEVFGILCELREDSGEMR